MTNKHQPQQNQNSAGNGALIHKQPWIGALREVVEERVVLVEVPLGRRVLRQAGEAQYGLVDGLVSRPKRLLLDVSHHPALENAPDLRAALKGGHPAHYRLGLDILEHRLAIGVAKRVSWQADRRLVVQVAWPLLPRCPWRGPVWRDPQRQAVVGDVVM